MSLSNLLANLPWRPQMPPKVEQAAVRNYVHDSDLGDCVQRTRNVPTLQEDPKRKRRRRKSHKRQIQGEIPSTKRDTSKLSEANEQAIQLEQALKYRSSKE